MNDGFYALFRDAAFTNLLLLFIFLGLGYIEHRIRKLHEMIGNELMRQKTERRGLGGD